MRRNYILIIFLLVFLAGCKSNRITLPSLQGMIYDGNNEAVSDVEIFIEDKHNATSDIYGHFTLTGLDTSKTYNLRASKKGFEDVNLTFPYSVPSQVIYLRMYSHTELLLCAENMVKDKKYVEAENYLKRAELAGGSYLSINYLRACIKYLISDFDSSLKIINDIINEGYVDSYIYLLLADIYETGFSDAEKAKEFLQKSLELSYDPVVEKRLNSK